eukprot:760261-Hanusia_phi.AAC.3
MERGRNMICYCKLDGERRKRDLDVSSTHKQIARGGPICRARMRNGDREAGRAGRGERGEGEREGGRASLTYSTRCCTDVGKADPLLVRMEFDPL